MDNRQNIATLKDGIKKIISKVSIYLKFNDFDQMKVDAFQKWATKTRHLRQIGRQYQKVVDFMEKRNLQGAILVMRANRTYRVAKDLNRDIDFRVNEKKQLRLEHTEFVKSSEDKD